VLNRLPVRYQSWGITSFFKNKSFSSHHLPPLISDSSPSPCHPRIGG
jgi:hypothetical protein